MRIAVHHTQPIHGRDDQNTGRAVVPELDVVAIVFSALNVRPACGTEFPDVASINLNGQLEVVTLHFYLSCPFGDFYVPSVIARHVLHTRRTKCSTWNIFEVPAPDPYCEIIARILESIKNLSVGEIFFGHKIKRVASRFKNVRPIRIFNPVTRIHE
jgi:hypothetical protein